MATTPAFAELESTMTAAIAESILNRRAHGYTILDATRWVSAQWLDRASADGQPAEVLAALAGFIQRVGVKVEKIDSELAAR